MESRQISVKRDFLPCAHTRVLEVLVICENVMYPTETLKADFSACYEFKAKIKPARALFTRHFD